MSRDELFASVFDRKPRHGGAPTEDLGQPGLGGESAAPPESGRWWSHRRSARSALLIVISAIVFAGWRVYASQKSVETSSVREAFIGNIESEESAVPVSLETSVTPHIEASPALPKQEVLSQVFIAIDPLGPAPLEPEVPAPRPALDLQAVNGLWANLAATWNAAQGAAQRLAHVKALLQHKGLSEPFRSDVTAAIKTNTRELQDMRAHAHKLINELVRQDAINPDALRSFVGTQPDRAEHDPFPRGFDSQLLLEVIKRAAEIASRTARSDYLAAVLADIFPSPRSL